MLTSFAYGRWNRAKILSKHCSRTKSRHLCAKPMATSQNNYHQTIIVGGIEIRDNYESQRRHMKCRYLEKVLTSLTIIDNNTDFLIIIIITRPFVLPISSNGMHTIANNTNSCATCIAQIFVI